MAPMMNSHHPITTPRNAVAAKKATASGHQLCGL
jgi:hypothetical protein